MVNEDENRKFNNKHFSGLITILSLMILAFTGYVQYEVYNQYDRIKTCEDSPSISCPKFTCVDGSLPEINLETGEVKTVSFLG